MRPFDWERLFREQHVPYVTSGPNVKRGELAIRCPFCGSADPSHHMGLNLETGWWSCWRNRAQHSGKSPLRLIMKLLQVPYGKAREIAGLGDDYVDPEGFDAVAARILGRNQAEPTPTKTERRFLTMDADFMTIGERLRTRKHWNYLYADRGFGRTVRGIEDVDLLVKQYGLMAGVSNEWADRVIIPFYQDGKLVTWTGRAVGPAKFKYRDLELKESLLGPKETLYNFDCIEGGGEALVLQEGPFDVLKIDYYGRSYGVRSVGLSTNSISEAQTYLLRAAEGKFRRTIVMMDTKKILGIVDSMRMRQSLTFLSNVSISPVPFGAGDGGAMSSQQVIQWARAL